MEKSQGHEATLWGLWTSWAGPQRRGPNSGGCEQVGVSLKNTQVSDGGQGTVEMGTGGRSLGAGAAGGCGVGTRAPPHTCTHTHARAHTHVHTHACTCTRAHMHFKKIVCEVCVCLCVSRWRAEGPALGLRCLRCPSSPVPAVTSTLGRKRCPLLCHRPQWGSSS